MLTEKKVRQIVREEIRANLKEMPDPTLDFLYNVSFSTPLGWGNPLSSPKLKKRELNDLHPER